MARSDTKQVARPEGRLRGWNELTEDQRGALDRACALLGDIAGRKWEPPEHDRSRRYDFLPPIDAERHNHVLLIDGGRGTGKTAVLLALLDLLNRGVRGDTIEDESEDGRKALGDLARQAMGVVPVGLVDLQPLPPSTNLLMHLVGQLQRVVEALSEDATGDTRGSRERAPWEAEEHPKSDVRKAWREFLSAAALGWGGQGIEPRRAQLDPEAFTFELEQTERSRIDVPRAFRGLVDALAKSFREQRLIAGLPERRYPLFLIPVDDADMNPERAVELLDLVRTLWHPRAAFVLTGHSELFRARLHLQLRPFLIPNSPLQQEVGRVTDVVHLEDDLVRQIYGKAIPPAHRLHLPPLRLQDRVKIARVALSRIPAPAHSLQLRHMAEYLDLVTDAAAVLPKNLRELVDFQGWVLDRVTASPEPINALAEDMLLLLGSEEAARDRLLLETRRQFPRGLPPKAIWTDQQRWTLTEPARIALVEVFEFSSGRGVRIATSARLGTTEPVASEDEVGAKVFSLDVVQRAGRQRVTPRLPALVTTTTPAGNFEWPLPDTNSPVDFAALHICLTAAFADSHDAATLAKRYIAVILDYVELCAKGRENTSRSIKAVLEALGAKVRSSSATWKTLARRARRQAASSIGFRQESIAWWAEGLIAWFAAPELGLAAMEANRWLAALKEAYGGKWPAVRRRIQDSWTTLLQTRAIAPAALTWGPNQDKRLAFNWVSEIEETSRKALHWTNLVKRLSEMDIPHVAAAPSPGTFWPAYVSIIPERAVALAELPEAIVEGWEKSLGHLMNDRYVMSGGLLALWQLLGNSLSHQGLPLAPKALNIKTMMQAYQDAARGKWPWRFEPASTSYTIEHGLKIRSGKFTWTNESRLSSPLARTLFEMFWDFTLDAGDADKGGPSDEVDDRRLRWWSAIGGSPGVGGPDYGWPAVSWWSFLDHHLLVKVWDKRNTWVRERAEAVRGSAELGEELAFWYVRVIDTLLLTRDLRDDLWMNAPRAENWKSIFDTMESRFINSLHLRARYACYREWFYRVPLLAAPESGLGEEAAERILTAFGYRLNITLLRLARRARIADTFGWDDEDRISEHLASIDATAPNHPWVEQIEKATTAPIKDAPQDAPPRRRRSSPRKS